MAASPKKPTRRPAGSGRARPSARDATRAPRQADRVEQSAGGVVFKRTPRGVRFALLLDPYGKWTFAKGHVEPGETVEEAALRETREEMGLRSLRVIRPLGEIDFWFRDRYREETRGRLIHKYVRYFLMQVPERAWGKPQRQERISRLGWFSLEQVKKMSGYRDVRPILVETERYFRSQANSERSDADAVRAKPNVIVQSANRARDRRHRRRRSAKADRG